MPRLWVSGSLTCRREGDLPPQPELHSQREHAFEQPPVSPLCFILVLVLLMEACTLYFADDLDRRVS